MPIVQFLELPNQDTFHQNTIQVEGWAFSTTGPLKEVTVLCGKQKVKASIHLPRTDVGECHPAFAEYASESGYRAEITISEKDAKKTQSIRIIIKAGTEQMELPELKMYSPAVRNTIGRFGFIAALKKMRIYFKSGKYPHNLTDLGIQIRKFFRIMFGKPISIGYSRDDDPEHAYQIWLLKNQMDDRKRASYAQQMEEFTYRPLISILMPAYDSDKALLKKAIASVRNQIYPNWELIINDDASPSGSMEEAVAQCADGDARIKFNRMEKNSNISTATNVAANLAQGEFFFFMDHDDTLEENALFALVECLNRNPTLDVIYSDDDKISMDDVRYDPQFKPDYSPELLLSYMYFSHIFVVRKSLFYQVGGCRTGYEGAQDYDLALRVTELTDKIAHIPQVLYHWRAAPNSTALSSDTKPKSIERGRMAVADAVERRGLHAKAVIPDFAEKAKIGIYTLEYNGEDYPKISIIIPTKNHLNVLRRCLESIEQKTDYPNYEIILVDNGSDEKDVLKYYNTLSYKVIWCDNVDGRFNFSHMVNCGVENSDGEYIVLLNNDTEVIASNWLKDLLVYTQIPGVGITGCKLLYADGTVQHAGVVMKMFNGIAGHAFKLLPDWDGGYLSYANTARNYSAVTAAAFMTTREIYNQAGLFDEENFSVSFNDVDFCLRVRELGYRVVFSPSAKLYHHEGKSRGVEQSGYYSNPREEYNLISRWGLNTQYRDPYYNPNLSLVNEQFRIECRHVVPRSRGCKRVVLISHNLNYEGAPLMQLHIAQGLNDRYNFLVLTPEDGPLRKEYEVCGIEVRVFPTEEMFTSREMLEEKLQQISETIAEFSPDLIYSNTILMFIGVKLGHLMGVPVVWGIHESVDYKTFFDAYGSGIADLAVRQLMSATRVVFVADATAKMYEDLDTYNFAVIKNGIDIDRIENYIRSADRNAIRERLKIAPEEKVVSIFGAVCFRKGQKVFVNAAKQLTEETDAPLRFLIVGAKESSYLNELRQMIAKHSMEERVQIIGVCDDIFQYYVASDYFVCASYEESSPQVVIEAMAFHLPIVSTNVFGIPELVRNNNEALLVEPGKPKAIAESLKKLIADSEMAARLTDHAYYRLLEKFTNEIMLSNYDQLFQEAYEEGENMVYQMVASKKG